MLLRSGRPCTEKKSVRKPIDPITHRKTKREHGGLAVQSRGSVFVVSVLAAHTGGRHVGKRPRRFVSFCFYPSNVIFFYRSVSPSSVHADDRASTRREQWRGPQTLGNAPPCLPGHTTRRGVRLQAGKNIQSDRDRWRPKVER